MKERSGHQGVASVRSPRNRRIRAQSYLVVAIALVVSICFQVPAAAQTECYLGHEFVYDFQTGFGVHGTRNVHMVRTHNFNLDCIDIVVDDSRFWSTAHVENQNRSKWVEVGWEERNTTPRYDTFVEWGTDPAQSYRFNGPNLSCCAWSVSKVFYLSSNAKWHFQFDYGNDGSFVTVYPPTAIGWTTGYAYSETGAYSTFDPYDHFKDLMRTTNGQGTLAPWQNNIPDDVLSDGIPGREWNWIATDEWDLPEV